MPSSRLNDLDDSANALGKEAKNHGNVIASDLGIGKKISNNSGQTSSGEHGSADPRTRACTAGAFTPGIASGSELKSERSSRCWEKSVRSVNMRVGMYSGVERFRVKGRRLNIERTEFRMDGSDGGCPRRHRKLRDVEEGGDERVSDMRVVYHQELLLSSPELGAKA
jgi:hypothetical protein